ncbi:MAG TPA: chemotaxis protein CheW [Fimbriimonadaceae bacterium]|nr:chemotaxis protein CheW [Fimbriimonadaceae bacterium]
MKPTAKSPEGESSKSSERQLVALELGDEIYGIDIACIHTVLMPQSITAVPKTPEYVKGVMNLRGQILPVIDMRLRFDLPAESHPKTRIVIVNVGGVAAGLIVDAISEVVRLPESEVEPPSVLLSSVAADCITGIGRSTSRGDDGVDEQRLILILDVYKLLTGSLSEADLASLAA